MVHTHPDSVPFRLTNRRGLGAALSPSPARRGCSVGGFDPRAHLRANVQTELGTCSEDDSDEDSGGGRGGDHAEGEGDERREAYVVRLRFDDTVGDLRRRLEKVSGEDEDDANVGNEFEIRGGYPPRAFTEDEVTLREAGLVPNAALLLKPVSKR